MPIGWRMGRQGTRDDVIDFVFSSFCFRFFLWTAMSPSTVWRSILIVRVWLGVQTGKRRTSTEESTPQGNQKKTWQSFRKWRYLNSRKCLKKKKRSCVRSRAVTTIGLAPGANSAPRAPPTPKNKNKIEKKSFSRRPKLPWFFCITCPFLLTHLRAMGEFVTSWRKKEEGQLL